MTRSLATGRGGNESLLTSFIRRAERSCVTVVVSGEFKHSWRGHSLLMTSIPFPLPEKFHDGNLTYIATLFVSQPYLHWEEALQTSHAGGKATSPRIIKQSFGPLSFVANVSNPRNKGTPCHPQWPSISNVRNLKGLWSPS